jgi:hypothetical protein
MATSLRPTTIGIVVCALGSLVLLPHGPATSAQMSPSAHDRGSDNRQPDDIDNVAVDGDDNHVEQDDREWKRRVHVFLPAKPEIATLYADGSAMQTDWDVLWRPMCNSDATALSEEDLLDLIEAHDQAFLPGSMGPDDGAGGISGGGLNIQFVIDGSVPPNAANALDIVENYLENKFDDPITISITVSFDTLPFGVLGATGAYYTKASWSVSRNALKSDMDDTDKVQNYLPAGSTMPVRWNGDSGTVSQETRVFWTRANFRAAVGSVSGSAGDLVFNENFNWDFDPSNGVVGYSFQDVVVHEVGHVLGFSSGADFRDKDIEALDIYRFQRSNGGNDYNPDTLSEFKVRPRLVDLNKPNDDHICDTITQESRMSDGNPYQAGHFREQSSNIGLMDPALAAGETHSPGFFSTPDLRFFDAIGYDR